MGGLVLGLTVRSQCLAHEWRGETHTPEIPIARSELWGGDQICDLDVDARRRLEPHARVALLLSGGGRSERCRARRMAECDAISMRARDPVTDHCC